MAFSTSFSQEVLSLIFQNQDIANLGDASGVQASAVNGSFEVALLKTGSVEADYTGYARVEYSRNTGTFGVVGTSAVNLSEITFPTCTNVGNTIVGFRLYYGANGTTPYTAIIGDGTLTSTTTISAGETPKFQAQELTINFS